MAWQEITNKDQWDKNLLKTPSANFLQSWAFGEFHSSIGNSVWRFGFSKDQELTGFCQIVKLSSKFTKFFYCPGGPVLNYASSETISQLIALLKNGGEKEDISFIRLDMRNYSQEIKDLLTVKGFRTAPSFVQPECSLTLDLQQPVETLKSHLSESTKYNIGWVERKGVRVEVSSNLEDINIFTSLLNETATRHKFRLYKNIDYYKKQYESFFKSSNSKLFLAREPIEFGNDVLAAAIVIYFGDTATYLHAASSSKNPKLRAPYLMQWKIILDAKENGFLNYDFWGVAKDDSKKDPWSGVTEFKRGFGGKRVFYQPPLDLMLKKSYFLEAATEYSRRILRKLKGLR